MVAAFQNLNAQGSLELGDREVLLLMQKTFISQLLREIPELMGLVRN